MAELPDKFIDSLLTGSYVENKDSSEYLKKVGNFGVDQLLKEPHRLREEKQQLQKETQELVFNNYSTFIQTADCSRQIFNQFNVTEKKLDGILSQLPQLQSKCQNLAKVSKEINAKKEINKRVLTRTSQLTYILELPQLMDSCIRQGQFEEALELFSYIRRLGQKHNSIPLIKSVVTDLEGSWRGMVHQLLAQFRTDLPLSKCLQTMGFLRRMEVYNDAELRLKFLQARDAWLRGLITSLTVTPGENLSLKKLEILRGNLLNIVTQHRAMFVEEDAVLPSPDAVNEPCIFYTWLIEQMAQILAVVDEGSAGKAGDTLDTLLGQTMYFGLSFSRFGADFRGLAALRIHRAALTMVETGLRRAARRFEQDMSRYVLAPGTAAFTPPAAAGDGPPLLLLEFPPLAELTNGILRVFNDLRTCAPLSTAHAVTLILRDILKTSTKVILAFCRQEQTALGPGERATLGRFCVAYQALLSYLGKALTLLYPFPQLAQHLGLPIHQIQTLELISLKEDSIVEPLAHLLPRQEI